MKNIFFLFIIEIFFDVSLRLQRDTSEKTGFRYEIFSLNNRSLIYRQRLVWLIGIKKCKIWNLNECRNIYQKANISESTTESATEASNLRIKPRFGVFIYRFSTFRWGLKRFILSVLNVHEHTFTLMFLQSPAQKHFVQSEANLCPTAPPR